MISAMRRPWKTSTVEKMTSVVSFSPSFSVKAYVAIAAQAAREGDARPRATDEI